ncbi:DUF2304 domain-containing protein [Sporosarcina gallistercoris]|uniref:DUF2304 domain-containing protein n=1 Tax=Sporosarcina gallistercoris TaxID=2762245 RepID=A0ABR8PM31_9BACL|nr:DUF2304 domain-containing protein [Sporosarcina gallistercoris]MBD7909231.1 DUF2304 domain-containing protein [Sporosarcina gallistercoris]
MSGTIQLITFLAALLFFLQVIYLTARNKLHDKYAFLWILFALVGIGASFCLPLLNKIATQIGITYMPSLVFMAAFLVVLILLTYQTVIISKHEKLIKQLVQEIAFLDHAKEQSEMRSEK